MLDKGQVGIPANVTGLHKEGLINHGDPPEIDGLYGEPDGNVDQIRREKVGP